MLCLVSLTRQINEILALSNVPTLSRTFPYQIFRVAEVHPEALPTCQFFSFLIISVLPIITGQYSESHP